MYLHYIVVISVIQISKGEEFEHFTTNCRVNGTILWEYTVRSGLECAAECSKGHCSFYSYISDICLIHSMGPSPGCSRDLVQPGWVTMKKKGTIQIYMRYCN